MMTLARRIARPLVPALVKRRVEHRRTRRFLQVVNQVNQWYATEHELIVRRGPFEGMRYPAGFLRDSGDIVAKLVGTYEMEITHVISAWVGERFDRIVDVGAAEGYYAVGFAYACPATTVLAYDIDPVARERCAEMARVNHVSERVLISPECTPESLVSLPPGRTALLADCEGCEATLLDPSVAPVLRTWSILVELHDFLDPTISETVLGRFTDSHEIELTDGQARTGVAPPELEGLDDTRRDLVLSEHRPGPMQWAYLRPRD